MMRERGLGVDHSTAFRWVQRYAPKINKRNCDAKPAWFLLLAEGNKAVETDHPLCEAALAAASVKNLQVADGSSKLISGQGD
jgi:hypothetical protein